MAPAPRRSSTSRCRTRGRRIGRRVHVVRTLPSRVAAQPVRRSRHRRDVLGQRPFTFAPGGGREPVHGRVDRAEAHRVNAAQTRGRRGPAREDRAAQREPLARIHGELDAADERGVASAASGPARTRSPGDAAVPDTDTAVEGSIARSASPASGSHEIHQRGGRPRAASDAGIRAGAQPYGGHGRRVPQPGLRSRHHDGALAVGRSSTGAAAVVECQTRTRWSPVSESRIARGPARGAGDPRRGRSGSPRPRWAESFPTREGSVGATRSMFATSRCGRRWREGGGDDRATPASTRRGRDQPCRGHDDGAPAEPRRARHQSSHPYLSSTNGARASLRERGRRHPAVTRSSTSTRPRPHGALVEHARAAARRRSPGPSAPHRPARLQDERLGDVPVEVAVARAGVARAS